MASGIPRTPALLAATLMVSLASAGCFAGPPADGEASTASVDVTFFLTGFDSPEAGDDLAVTLTIGHIGLYDANRKEWMPVLAEAVTVDLFFDQLDPAVVVQVPVAVGHYTDAEMVLDAAHVFSSSMETEAAVVDAATCLTTISLDLTGSNAPTELELLVSGSEAVRGGPGAWTVRPAIVGSFSNAEDTDAALGDASCS